MSARKDRATEIDSGNEIGSNVIEIDSQSTEGKTYTVDLEEQSCECPDHQFRGVTCKHLYAAAEQVGWLELE